MDITKKVVGKQMAILGISRQKGKTVIKVGKSQNQWPTVRKIKSKLKRALFVYKIFDGDNDN